MELDSRNRLVACFSGNALHHEINPEITKSKRFFALSDRQRSRRFPSRLLRYFVPFHWLGREAVRRGRPLSVCEIGLGYGSMKRYVSCGLETLDVIYSDAIAHWVGVDVKLQHCYLDELSYDELIQADLEQDVDRIPASCDVYILLHVLEHLYHPEASIQKLFSRVEEGALIIVGFPSHPHFAIPIREPYIRAHTKANGHVSAISNARFKKAARANGCEIEEVRGAYFLRASGLFLEDYRWWQRFNLAWGRLFPSWPGESFVAARKLLSSATAVTRRAA